MIFNFTRKIAAVEEPTTLVLACCGIGAVFEASAWLLVTLVVNGN